MSHYDEQREEVEKKVREKPKGTVAISLKEESGDDYLRLYVDKSLNDIEEELLEDIFHLEMIYDYEIVSGPDTDHYFVESLYNILKKLTN